MTAENPFAAALTFIWGDDRDGHKNDSAPGETFRTSWGVTQQTWDYAVAHGIVVGDLAAASQDQCAAIYRVLYWNACNCPALPPGVALMVFNDATLTGVGHATKMLQRVVGAIPDGVVGPDTIKFVGRFGVGALLDALVTADDAYFAALANAPMFLNGWTRRENDARMAGLSL